MKRKNINNKPKINVGLKHCDKCEYYLRCEECVGSLYKEEIPKLNKQIKVLEKALELACRTMLVPDGYCEDIDCPNVTCKDCLVEHFKSRAKEILKNE